MTLNYGDLDFALTNRMLIVSWPARNLECFYELNGTRDRIEWTCMTGFETAEMRRIASLMKNAGNRYLEELKLSQAS